MTPAALTCISITSDIIRYRHCSTACTLPRLGALSGLYLNPSVNDVSQESDYHLITGYKKQIIISNKNLSFILKLYDMQDY